MVTKRLWSQNEYGYKDTRYVDDDFRSCSINEVTRVRILRHGHQPMVMTQI